MPVNTTDYEFPDGWGLFTPAEKCRWYIRERVFRQAIRQDTAFGRRYRSQQSSSSDTPSHPRGHKTVYQALEDAEEDPYRYK